MENLVFLKYRNFLQSQESYYDIGNHQFDINGKPQNTKSKTEMKKRAPRKKKMKMNEYAQSQNYLTTNRGRSYNNNKNYLSNQSLQNSIRSGGRSSLSPLRFSQNKTKKEFELPKIDSSLNSFEKKYSLPWSNFQNSDDMRQISLTTVVPELLGQLKISDFKVAESQMSFDLKNRLQTLSGKFQNVADPKFLKLFDKRYVIFMEDGTDLNGFKTPQSPSQIQNHKIPTTQHKQIRMDINPYLIKYDYDIAAALSATKAVCRGSDAEMMENQQRFDQVAYKELLLDCSNIITGGRRQYKSMFLFQNGKQIRQSLKEIPADCKIILLSEEDVPDPDGKKKQSFLTEVYDKNPKFIGLKGNIYENITKEQIIECNKGKIEASIFERKKKFLAESHVDWRNTTKDKIEDRNHLHDAYLHLAPEIKKNDRYKNVISKSNQFLPKYDKSQYIDLRKPLQNQAFAKKNKLKLKAHMAWLQRKYMISENMSQTRYEPQFAHAKTITEINTNTASVTDQRSSYGSKPKVLKSKFKLRYESIGVENLIGDNDKLNNSIKMRKDSLSNIKIQNK